MALIFISWSGERSLAVAEALREWLPVVIQSAQPWTSATDIEKGSRWEQEVSAKLDQASVGVVCLTPENLDSHWLLFEAGALSKKLGKAQVCTYLLGVQPHAIQPPLGMFQHTIAEKGETRRLVEVINKRQETPVAEGPLNKLFERMWPELEATLSAIPEPERTAKPARSLEDMTAEMLEIIRRLPDDLQSAVAREAINDRVNAILRRTVARQGLVPLESSGNSGAQLLDALNEAAARIKSER